MSKQRKRREYVVSAPVTPYPELLPLGDPNIPWERFEAFCEDLISRLKGVQSCHRYGGQVSILGVPVPQDTALREQASATLTRFVTGTPAHRFYSSLVEHADASIKDQLARDEEMLD